MLNRLFKLARPLLNWLRQDYLLFEGSRAATMSVLRVHVVAVSGSLSGARRLKADFAKRGFRLNIAINDSNRKAYPGEYIEAVPLFLQRTPDITAIVCDKES